ncbi:helix-turn-helix domain-containing protein [Kribbella sp. NPDC056345]|uniref:helix-turn-helix domain-containing protein n=1 Tax=Kribbella sp. NPDC056345 TaxID=3345789 RepID=UPI0035D94EBB
MEAGPIGTRIRELRGKVLTQKQLADSAGVSVDLIRKLEQGSRQTTTIASLQKLARALDVEVGELVSHPASLPSVDPEAGVVAIRRALTPIDDLIGEDIFDAEALTLQEASRTVDYAWGAYWNGRYELLGSVLPTALSQLRATAHAVSAEDRARAHELLARIYWVTGCSLVHLGHADPAYLAIRQALQAANEGNDPLLDATLRGSVGWQLLVQGRYKESEAVVMRAAASIEPRGDALPQELSTYGSLVLQGATAAGRDHRSAQAQDFVATAAEIADRVGSDRRDYETYFGPSQVVMQTVDVNVVTENYTQAISAAKRMPAEPNLPLASRARHLADRALAHANLGQSQKALDILLTAERIGPDWIKHQSLPRQIVSSLLDNDRQAPLRSLARRLGVHD